MALTPKRREELAVQLDTAATWLSHAGRAGKLRAIAAELRGEDVVDETAEQVAERREAAEQAERDAQEVAAARRPKAQKDTPS